MNKGKIKISNAAKFLMMFFVLLSGVAFSMMACTPQTIPTAAGAAPTATSTPNANYTPVTNAPNALAGSIAITGILRNGNSSFSFVNTTASNIASGTVIYFTNFSYDATLNSGAGSFADMSNNTANAATTVEEGTISYTLTTALPPYTEVVIGSSGDTSSTYGTVANVGNGTITGISNNTSKYLFMNHNGEGDKIFAYEGSAVTPGGSVAGITFINALIFGPDSWTTSGNPIVNSWDSYLPWAATYSFTNGNQTAPTGSFPYFCAVDLSTLFGAMGGQNTATQNQNAVLTSSTAAGQTTLNGIENGTLWTGNSGSKSAFEFGGTFVAMSACNAGTAGYQVSYSGETSY